MERRASGLRLLGYALTKVEYLLDGRISFCVISHPELKSLGCETGDYEGIVETMLFTEGVEVACICIERAPSQLKLSFRSRCLLDVAQLAQQISADGGGHPRAAGLKLNAPLESEIPKIRSHLLLVMEGLPRT